MAVIERVGSKLCVQPTLSVPLLGTDAIKQALHCLKTFSSDTAGPRGLIYYIFTLTFFQVAQSCLLDPSLPLPCITQQPCEVR